MLAVESSWQSQRNILIGQGVTDINQLALCTTQAGKIRKLKVSITNHFCIYQGLENNERSIKTDHTKYDVLRRK